MKIENNIGWCDETTNAVTGCDKVSPGCKNCYAEAGTRARVLRAQGKETWGAKGERVPVNFEPVFRRLNKLCVCDQCHESGPFSVENVTHRFRDPLSLCNGSFRRIRLFADSNSDWLDPKWPVETLARFLDAIRLAPNVDVLLLTKRIELFKKRFTAVMDERCEGDYPEPDYLFEFVEKWISKQAPSNVWLGVSVEDQKRADERIPLLLETPAAIRFLSVEPLLEEVDLSHYLPHYREPGRCKHVKVNWAIVGGESGKKRRDCGVNAIESATEQCVHAGVPVYVKQDSAFASGQQGRISDAFWKRKEFPR